MVMPPLGLIDTSIGDETITDPIDAYETLSSNVDGWHKRCEDFHSKSEGYDRLPKEEQVRLDIMRDLLVKEAETHYLISTNLLRRHQRDLNSTQYDGLHDMHNALTSAKRDLSKHSPPGAS